MAVEFMSIRDFMRKEEYAPIHIQIPILSLIPAGFFHLHPAVKLGYSIVLSVGVITLGALNLERHLIKKGKYLEAEALNDLFKIALMTGFVVIFIWFCGKIFRMLWLRQ